MTSPARKTVQPLNAHAGALWAIRSGIPVLRVVPNGKEPFASGVNEATTDEATVEAWFRERPDLNYGMAMGNGLVALDCDTKHASYHADYLELEYPTTLETETASGGAHIVLRVDFDAGQRKLRDAPSIDVRARGGYIVGPGSIVNGRRYRLVHDAPVAPCPPELAARISRRGEKATDNTTPIGDLDTTAALARAWGIVASHRGVDQGNRDNEAFRVACLIKDEGVSEPECLDLMRRFNAEKVHPPLGDGDIERIVPSAYRNGQRPPGWANPANDFDKIDLSPATAPHGPLTEGSADIDIDEIIKWRMSALIKGILHPGEQAVMYADPGAGKSFVALDLAWHVAQGKPWHGRKVKQAPVLYVALEGVEGFRGRMKAAEMTHGPAPWLRRQKAHVSLIRENAGAQGMATVLAAVKETADLCGQPVGLIIIDTLARAMAGDDENSAKDVMHCRPPRRRDRPANGGRGADAGAHQQARFASWQPHP